MTRVPYWAPLDAPPPGGINPWDIVTLTASAIVQQPSDQTYTNEVAQDYRSGGVSLYPTVQAVSGKTIRLPGISKIQGISKDARYNVQIAPGVDNAPIYYLGANPGTFEIVCNVWLPSQWAALQNVLETVYIAPNKTTPVASYAIGHPIVVARKFAAVLITKITGPEDGDYGDSGGSMKVTFSCIEYAPPPKVIPPRPTLIGQAPNAVTGFAGGSPQAAPGSATATGAIANPPSKAIKPTP